MESGGRQHRGLVRGQPHDRTRRRVAWPVPCGAAHRCDANPATGAPRHVFSTNYFVYDLGQNAALLASLTAHGPAGSTIAIEPAELTNSDGSINRNSAGGGTAYWQYTLAGTGEESWTSRFFYHGCRYVQVTLSAARGFLATAGIGFNFRPSHTKFGRQCRQLRLAPAPCLTTPATLRAGRSGTIWRAFSRIVPRASAWAGWNSVICMGRRSIMSLTADRCL
jgi:hypothetical protein